MSGKVLGFVLIALLIGAAALAFGAVEAWAEVWLRFGAVAACAAVFWARDPREVIRGNVGAILLPAVLLVGWGFFQSLPLPRAVAQVLSPRAAQLKTQTVPPGGGAAMPSFLMEKAAAEGVTIESGAQTPQGVDDAGSRAAMSSLSIAPFATRQACLAWLTPLLFALAAATLARDRVMRYRLLWAVAAWAGVLGAIAIAQHVAWNGKLLWIRPTPTDASPVGPFVNPNHFAGYVELAALIAIGLLLAVLGGAEGGLSRASVRAAIMDRTWALPRVLALSSLAILGVAGLVLSGSRGGLIAFTAGLAILVSTRWTRRWLPAAATAVLVVALAMGLVSWLGSERHTLQSAFFTERVDDVSLDIRSDIWGRTWRILVDYPITGTGLGTFPWAYASYDREGEWLGTLQAHDDFLQLASETGVVGTGLLIWLIAAFGRKAIRPALGTTRGRPTWTSAALVAAVFAMFAHSILEFVFQIPAVACLFAVIAGMLVGAAGEDSEPSAAGTPS